MGFKTVNHKIYNEIDIKHLSDILLERRTESEYEIDGIIVMDNKVYPTASAVILNMQWLLKWF